METQGSHIFHKLLKLTPRQLKKVLKEKHRGALSSAEKNGKMLIHHPSPSSFACIDMVFLLSNNWSPFFSESASVHINKLTQILVKAMVIYALFHICDKYLLIAFHQNELKKKDLINADITKQDNPRSEYIKSVTQSYVKRFSKLKTHRILIKIRKSFETCVRWYIALGFIPVQVAQGNALFKEVCQWASQSMSLCKEYSDEIQSHLVAYFATFEYSLRKYIVLSPVTAKDNIVISSKDGLYTATTYEGDDIELLSFDEYHGDCTSAKVSLAGSMLPHEYLYLFAHDTYAIQTTQKLSQSTIVVSSEPSFSIQPKKTASDDAQKKSIFNNLNSLQELQNLYKQMSEDGKERIALNPTVLTMLESEVPNHNQVKVLKDMFERLKDKTLTQDFGDSDVYAGEKETSCSSNIFDVHDNPMINKQKSIETIQEVKKKAQVQQLESKLRESVKTIALLRNNLTKYIEKNAIDNLTISILKLEKEEEMKNVINIKKEIKHAGKLNDELTKQINNMAGVVKDLTSRINTTQEENKKFLNLIMKGKNLNQDIEGDIDTTWVMTPDKRNEIVNIFLSMLNFGKERNMTDHKWSMNLYDQYENLLIDMKMEIVPLFKKVRNKKHLDLCNSWVPKDIQDKLSCFSQLIEADQKIENDDMINVYETPSLKVIDINPISSEEQERIKKVADSTADVSSVIGPNGLSASLFTKKFYNIQFPQAGNIDIAVDKGIKEMWSQMMKCLFLLDPPMYTVTGQEILAGPSQGTYEKFIIPYLTFMLGNDDYIRETVALLIKLENKQMFEHGAKDMDTFLFDDIFYFFWDSVI